MNVANCRSCIDATAGDQSGNEWRIQSWYSFPWDVVLRHPDERVQHLISNYARHAAINNYCGYNQNTRLTFWNALKEVADYDPANIFYTCDADCSSSTAAIVKAVGYRLGDNLLQGVNEGLTTFYMLNAFENVGFMSKYGTILTNQGELLPGDVLLNINNHVCIAVADSDYSIPAGTEQTETETPTEETGESSETIVSGDVVAVKSNAKYYDGNSSIPKWVYDQNWVVWSVYGDRAVLNYSEDRKMHIMSPFNVKDLVLVKSATTETEPVEADEEAYVDGEERAYTVKSGDSLWGIAQKYLGDGNLYMEIAEANNLQSPDLIFPGQTLVIP